jgi:hypothetical protein
VPGRSPLRLWSLFYAAFVSAVAAAALVALASWLVAGPGAGATLRLVERRIAAATGGEARLGRLDLRLWRLEARFHQLDVTIPAETGPPLRLSVPEGGARLAWSGLAALAGGRLHLRELDLSRAKVTVEGRVTEQAHDRPRGPFDLRIDRLRVSDGVLRLADREAPMNIDATRVSVTAAWSSRERALVGDAELTLGVRRPPLVRALPLDLRTEFRLRSHDLQLRDLSARGAGLEAELEISASYLDEPTLVGRGRMRADLGRLGERMDPETPVLSGSLEASFSVEKGAGPLRVRGRARCGPGRCATARDGWSCGISTRPLSTAVSRGRWPWSGGKARASRPAVPATT